MTAVKKIEVKLKASKLIPPPARPGSGSMG
jgi:hypothetical protein